MRMDLLYYNSNKFSQVVSKVQNKIVEMKRNAQTQFEKDVYNYLINRLTEIKCQMKFSRLLHDTGIKNIVINDVDKIVRVGNEFKAIFELKVRRRPENRIKINASQLTTLRYLTEKLKVPVYYLIFLPGNKYQLIRLNYLEDYDIVEINKPIKHLSDRFAVIPVDEEEIYDRNFLIAELHDILTIL